MSTLTNVVTIRNQWGAPWNEAFQGMDGWTCTLRYKLARKQFSFPFYMGRALCREPAVSDVLPCLVSDAEALNMTFEEWCDTYGYDTDSRRAESTYRACVKIGRRIRKLFGDDYDVIAELAREM